MHLKTILNRVQNFKPFVYGTIRWVEHASAPTIEAELRPRAASAAADRRVGKMRSGCSMSRRSLPESPHCPADRLQWPLRQVNMVGAIHTWWRGSGRVYDPLPKDHRRQCESCAYPARTLRANFLSYCAITPAVCRLACRSAPWHGCRRYRR